MLIMNSNKDILDVKFQSNDLNKVVSIKDFLIELLMELWKEGEEFSAKRPLGNSRWKSDMYVELVKLGLVDGKIEYGEHREILVFDCDYGQADELICMAIKQL